jgi:hypothetical protein
MLLKRIVKNVENRGSDNKTSFVSRLSGGLSFNFNPKDPNVYE